MAKLTRDTDLKARYRRTNGNERGADLSGVISRTADFPTAPSLADPGVRYFCTGFATIERMQ
jgi:hypothetical protein